MNPIYIDFEFSATAERNVDLVCVAWSTSGTTSSVWLHRDDAAKGQFTSLVNGWCAEGRILVCYASAEPQAFIALGLDPHRFQWIDLFCEWRQLRHNNNKHLYGRCLKDGEVFVSQPPSAMATESTQTGLGLVDVIAHLFGKVPDVAHKEKMRNLILNKAATGFSSDEKQQILDYCKSDLVYLPSILKQFTEEMAMLTKVPPVTVRGWQLRRGGFSAACSLMTSEGIPIDLAAATRLTRNHNQAQQVLIDDLNQLYPFYTRLVTPKTVSWHFSQKALETYIQASPVERMWPKTASGKYSRSEKTLENFQGLPEIDALRKTLKSITQLRWFSPKNSIKFFETIGTDRRLRPFHAPFGSQTGRCQPRAKMYPFLMSNWLRCLIRPDSGQAIAGIDFVSQEFALAGYLSNDEQMISAYACGDPYIWFARKAGLVPPDATKGSHPEIRNLCKTLTLGLQYGMGEKALHSHLLSTGQQTTEAKTKLLLKTFKAIFHTHYSWSKNIVLTYRSKRHLTLPDGWTLMPDNPSNTSVANFPIQGTGACILRQSVINAQKMGLRVIAPVHDAIYIQYSLSDPSAPDRLAEAMTDAVTAILGPGKPIRLETTVHGAEEPWVEKKGEATYKKLSPFLTQT
jgi:hypothetical protein